MAMRKIGRASFVFPDNSSGVINVRSSYFDGKPCMCLENESDFMIFIMSQVQWEQLKRVIDRGFKSTEGLKDGNEEEKV